MSMRRDATDRRTPPLRPVKLGPADVVIERRETAPS